MRWLRSCGWPPPTLAAQHVRLIAIYAAVFIRGAVEAALLA